MSYQILAHGPHDGIARDDIAPMLEVAKRAILGALDSGDKFPVVTEKLWDFLHGGKVIERLVIERALIEVLVARGRS